MIRPFYPNKRPSCGAESARGIGRPRGPGNSGSASKPYTSTGQETRGVVLVRMLSGRPSGSYIYFPRLTGAGTLAIVVRRVLRRGINPVPSPEWAAVVAANSGVFVEAVRHISSACAPGWARESLMHFAVERGPFDRGTDASNFGPQKGASGGVGSKVQFLPVVLVF
jgi:hypothetical protein